VSPSPRPARRALLLVVVIAVSQVSLIGLASAQLSPPPPTPVPPDGSLSPFPTALDTPADPLAVPQISAASAVLAELSSGQVLYAKDPRARRAIASLTKIMTALLTLERSDPSEVVTVRPDAVLADRGGIAALGLEPGERISVADLLDALMLQSANDAAIALADHVAGSEPRFVRIMNRRAERLGMDRTHFRSPNGLDDRGTSTAQDLVTLTRAAYRTDGFAPIVAQLHASVPAPDGSTRELQNRNAMLWLYPGAVGVKTGYTSAAGYCVVAVAEREGRSLVAVVLGAPGDAFSDAAALLDHGFAAFEEHTFVEAGEPNGVVSLVGGAVPVETGARLVALVATSALEDVRERVEVDPAAAYPPAPGERVATLRISIPGFDLGSVPLVVSSVPPPPPAPAGTWWGRTASAVGRAVGAAFSALFG
jgi:D-alanyl-D-alanine carboxypeptidase (penicillin-binding protein 5/6)